MNEGDCFLLDAGGKEFLFVWVGRNANRLEKLQAAKVFKPLDHLEMSC